jgi:hypothetical protein
MTRVIDLTSHSGLGLLALAADGQQQAAGGWR